MLSGTSTDSLLPSEAIIDEIAAEKNVSPEELNPPMYEVIDLDALDAIFRADTGHISFEYQGYTVTVDHSGSVDLDSIAAE